MPRRRPGSRQPEVPKEPKEPTPAPGQQSWAPALAAGPVPSRACEPVPLSRGPVPAQEHAPVGPGGSRAWRPAPRDRLPLSEPRPRGSARGASVQRGAGPAERGQARARPGHVPFRLTVVPALPRLRAEAGRLARAPAAIAIAWRVYARPIGAHRPRDRYPPRRPGWLALSGRRGPVPAVPAPFLPVRRPWCRNAPELAPPWPRTEPAGSGRAARPSAGRHLPGRDRTVSPAPSAPPSARYSSRSCRNRCREARPRRRRKPLLRPHAALQPHKPNRGIVSSSAYRSTFDSAQTTRDNLDSNKLPNPRTCSYIDNDDGAHKIINYADDKYRIASFLFS